ncbi:MAG TPA: toll/interleukin-1 receptor domain-containing protein [Chitinispirillaceae bacterium]|nr:toll/interleukin-1 receptor domain-containing protein [Chitinispirillaceae bacterium]
MDNPKVFISHASEDKDRFVLNFTKKLREKGIDAWLDKWEMKPGASLIDKIFVEDIGQSSAFIIIISNYSINEPWVHEELNKAAVDRIEKGTKLIPILIDDCKVPEVLTSTLWVKIQDLNSYETEFTHILHSIFETSEKQPIGNIPNKFTLEPSKINGLTPIDYEIFKKACHAAISADCYLFESDPFIELLEKSSYILSEIDESLKNLEANNLIKLYNAFGCKLDITGIEITSLGLETYFETEMPDLGEIQKKVALVILNNNLGNNGEISRVLNVPLLIITYIFEQFQSKKMIECEQTTVGYYRDILQVSPLLQRWANS